MFGKIYYAVLVTGTLSKGVGGGPEEGRLWERPGRCGEGCLRQKKGHG